MHKIFGTHRPLGIQLWSVKDEMAMDAKKTIKEIATFGYKRIELFEGENGITWGHSAKEFSIYLTDLGIEVKSAHCDPFTNFEQKVEDAAGLGLEYLVCAWLGPNDSLDFYKMALDRFNECAEICHKNGIKFAYHNHDYSLKPVEGVVPHELFLTQTDQQKMFFEMDAYWVKVAGQDPLKWIDDYPDRWTMVHVKDLARLPVAESSVSCLIGNGVIDYKVLIPDLINRGINYFYVEQEYFEGTSPLDAAQANFEYLSNL